MYLLFEMTFAKLCIPENLIFPINLKRFLKDMKMIKRMNF